MKPPPKQPTLVILLGTSCYLFMWSFIFDRVFRWTDSWAGFMDGVASSGGLIIIWLFVGLIPGLLIAGLYRWSGWYRFRTVAVLSPSIWTFCWIAAGLVIHPETAAYRFKRINDLDFPASARDIRTSFFGPGFAGQYDAFLFYCTPADTEKLIADLKLEPADPSQRRPHLPDPEWPTFSTWTDGPLYFGETRISDARRYFLLTNASRDQVYLIVHGHY